MHNQDMARQEFKNLPNENFGEQTCESTKLKNEAQNQGVILGSEDHEILRKVKDKKYQIDNPKV